MRVKDIMTRSAVWIAPESSLQEAAETMKELDIGALPVWENNRVVGMLTDRDITIRSVSDGHNPRTDRVRDAMTTDVIICFEDQDVVEAGRLMKQKRVRRLPVLNRERQLVGIVSLADLAVDAHDEHLTADVLQAVSEPAAPAR